MGVIIPSHTRHKAASPTGCCFFYIPRRAATVWRLQSIGNSNREQQSALTIGNSNRFQQSETIIGSSNRLQQSEITIGNNNWKQTVGDRQAAIGNDTPYSPHLENPGRGIFLRKRQLPVPDGGIFLVRRRDLTFVQFGGNTTPIHMILCNGVVLLLRQFCSRRRTTHPQISFPQGAMLLPNFTKQKPPIFFTSTTCTMVTIILSLFLSGHWRRWN